MVLSSLLKNQKPPSWFQLYGAKGFDPSMCDLTILRGLRTRRLKIKNGMFPILSIRKNTYVRHIGKMKLWEAKLHVFLQVVKAVTSIQCYSSLPSWGEGTEYVPRPSVATVTADPTTQGAAKWLMGWSYSVWIRWTKGWFTFWAGQHEIWSCRSEE